MTRLFAPIALLAACGSPDAPVLRAQVPEAAVSPAALDFGDAVVPLVHEEAVLVTNAGRAPLEFTATLTAADACLAHGGPTHSFPASDVSPAT